MGRNKLPILIFLIMLTLSPTGLCVALVDNHAVVVHRLHLDNSFLGDYSATLTRDTHGFLWITTENGIYRYDGYQLKQFSYNAQDPNSLGSSSTTIQLIDSHDQLWVGGENLSLYDSESESFRVFDIAQGEYIRTLYEDARGILWVAGEGFGLLAFDPRSTEVIFSTFTTGKESFITSMRPQKGTENIWVYSQAGLFLFDTLSYRTQAFPLPLEKGQVVHEVRELIEDRHGELWIGAENGLIRYHPLTQKLIFYQADPNTPGALKNHDIWSLLEDAEGNIWIGTDKQGVHKYVPSIDRFIHYPASPSLPHAFPPASITDIYQDRNGSLWFTAGFFGAMYISPALEKFIKLQNQLGVENSLAFNNVLDLHEAQDGSIWIATDGGGLDQYWPEKNEFKHFVHHKHKNSLSSNSVLALAEDKHYLWIGTWSGGLNRYDKKTGEFKHYTYQGDSSSLKSIGGNNIFRLEMAEDGRLLISVWHQGLEVFDPETEEFISYFPMSEGKESGIVNESINDIAHLRDDIYLIGGTDGLEMFDLQRGTFSTLHIDSLAEIYDIYVLNTEEIWIASANGLIHYTLTSNTYHIYYEEDGLPSNFIVSIEGDVNGGLWLGTTEGLSRFDLASESVETFDRGDGLTADKFNRYAHLRTNNGLMYFGGLNGINVFDPKHLPRNNAPPQVQITDFQILSRGDTPEAVALKQSAFTLDSVVLPYSQNGFIIEFSALSFIYPKKNQYRYRLLGLENSWSAVDSSQRRARYTNLSPGTYQFQVSGTNNDGVWSQHERRLNIRVMTPWWMTWWAKLIGLLVLCSILYAIFYARLSANRRAARKLKKLVSDKTAELENVNREVTQLNEQLEERVTQRTRELRKEVEERKLAESRAYHMAIHDALTELPNRAWLLERLSMLLHSYPRKTFALFFLDGDKFKKINDTHGHTSGDEILQSASLRLVECLPEQHYAVRLGGDEFTVLVEGDCEIKKLEALAQNIVRAFESPFHINQTAIYFRVSIGIVICDQSYLNSEDILHDADIAMYSAKKDGFHGYRVFDEQMRQNQALNSELEKDLNHAIERDQLHLVYQPIISLQDYTLRGFEALLRWRHPEHGMISPEKFIALAEESGYILDLGVWVFKKACQQLQVWRRDYTREFLPYISINLSPIQLAQEDILRQVDDTLQQTQVSGDEIILEITENALMENTQSVKSLLDSFRQRGITFAIDDFGTGYSSLSYLDKLPVQSLKIDKTFINSLPQTEDKNSGTREIVNATISLAHNLNIRVVAEGIETQQQLDMLHAMGCDYGQGYYIAKPLSVSEMESYLIGLLKESKSTVYKIEET